MIVIKYYICQLHYMKYYLYGIFFIVQSFSMWYSIIVIFQNFLFIFFSISIYQSLVWVNYPPFPLNIFGPLLHFIINVFVKSLQFTSLQTNSVCQNIRYMSVDKVLYIIYFPLSLKNCQLVFFSIIRYIFEEFLKFP